MALAAALIVAAALVAPAPVLRLEYGDRVIDVALPADGTYTYRYRQSIYDVPVLERQRVDGERLRITSARSIDRRALEYYRWPGEPWPDGDALIQEAPDISFAALDIRVTASGEQRIDALGGVDLLPAFGEGAVHLRASWIPRIGWLAALFR